MCDGMGTGFGVEQRLVGEPVHLQITLTLLLKKLRGLAFVGVQPLVLHPNPHHGSRRTVQRGAILHYALANAPAHDAGRVTRKVQLHIRACTVPRLHCASAAVTACWSPNWAEKSRSHSSAGWWGKEQSQAARHNPHTRMITRHSRHATGPQQSNVVQRKAPGRRRIYVKPTLASRSLAPCLALLCSAAWYRRSWGFSWSTVHARRCSLISAAD
jgi:hypothetical protein